MYYRDFIPENIVNLARLFKWIKPCRQNRGHYHYQRNLMHDSTNKVFFSDFKESSVDDVKNVTDRSEKKSYLY